MIPTFFKRIQSPSLSLLGLVPNPRESDASEMTLGARNKERLHRSIFNLRHNPPRECPLSWNRKLLGKVCFYVFWDCIRWRLIKASFSFLIFCFLFFFKSFFLLTCETTKELYLGSKIGNDLLLLHSLYCVHFSCWVIYTIYSSHSHNYLANECIKQNLRYEIMPFFLRSFHRLNLIAERLSSIKLKCGS